VVCRKELTDRSIGGGRFEALYKEVLPILQEVLDILAYLLAHAKDNAQRDLFVELTLTVPVRLTNLLPYLNYLMRPLTHALRGTPDSVSQGLRTFELCVDNLSAEFLDPTMSAVTDDLVEALNALLKPLPANRSHAQAAVKILGKLGGRNRRFVEVDLDLEWSATPSIPVTMALEGKKHELELGPLVRSAAKQLEGKSAEVWKEAFQVLKIAVLAVLQQVCRVVVPY
jgi:transformation/transcription domain-associated protein